MTSPQIKKRHNLFSLKREGGIKWLRAGGGCVKNRGKASLTQYSKRENLKSIFKLNNFTSNIYELIKSPSKLRGKNPTTQKPNQTNTKPQAEMESTQIPSPQKSTIW